MIVYHTFRAEQIPRMLELYADAGWTAYLGGNEKLARGMERSLYLLGAFEGELLVGFIRCTGDGEHIVYVQDLIVDSAYRRQGIGKTLLQKAREAYGQVRMFTLVTDTQDAGANAFYKSIHMRPYEDAGLTGYLW